MEEFLSTLCAHAQAVQIAHQETVALVQLTEMRLGTVHTHWINAVNMSQMLDMEHAKLLAEAKQVYHNISGHAILEQRLQQLNCQKFHAQQVVNSLHAQLGHMHHMVQSSQEHEAFSRATAESITRCFKGFEAAARGFAAGGGGGLPPGNP